MNPKLAVPVLSLLAASCYPPTPYEYQRPPYRNGAPYYPYAQGAETGDFEPVPDAGGRRGPQGPPPPRRPPVDGYGNPTPSPRLDTESAPVPDVAPPSRPSYPEAKPTATPGRVISPYAPYNVISVEGFKSGALAKDPSNNKIFRVP